jgi:hypothetical protein
MSGASRRRHESQAVDRFKRTAAHKGQRAIQRAMQTRQGGHQAIGHRHRLRRARHVEQSTVDIEKKSRVLAHRRHHPV